MQTDSASVQNGVSLKIIKAKEFSRREIIFLPPVTVSAALIQIHGTTYEP